MKWHQLQVNARRIWPHFVISHFPNDEQFRTDLEILSRNIQYILFSIDKNVDQVNQKIVHMFFVVHNYQVSFDIIPSKI